MDDLEANIRAVIYGLAVGDALGTPIQQSESATPPAPRVIDLRAGGGWERGEWGDDTALTLATAMAYQAIDFDIFMASEAMVRWARSDGRGIGQLTSLALQALDNGVATALTAGQSLMEMRHSAGNGSLMRCSSTGILRAASDPRLVTESVLLSSITHADPRCTASCVANNIVISHLLRGRVDIPAILREAAEASGSLCEEVGDVVLRVARGWAPRHQRQPVGFVLLTLERALWALMTARDYSTAMLEVVNMGGDTDTNGAVTGALLGARFGLQAIPQEWVEGLLYREVIEAGVALLVAAARAAQGSK